MKIIHTKKVAGGLETEEIYFDASEIKVYRGGEEIIDLDADESLVIYIE